VSSIPTTQLDRLLSALPTDGTSYRPMIELILASIGDGVAICDVTGETLYLNSAAKQILGLLAGDEPASIRSRDAELYYLDDFNPLPDKELPLALALEGKETTDLQVFARSALLPDGALINVNARPIRDAGGRVVGAIAVFHDVGARKRAEEELRVANAKLGAWVAELEHRATVSLLTNDMADLLQSCLTMEEFFVVVSSFAPRIFEGESGAMFVMNASRSAIELVVSWGATAPAERVFRPDCCWALRRGRLHRAGGGSLGPACAHTSSEGTTGYTCIPMMGQGEALGVLHVHGFVSAAQNVPELGAVVVESRLRTIISVAEHVALALANLKLRETLRTQAIRDPLTGLFNRRHMEESLEREIARASRAGGVVAALMIDIDHFKRFNDTFGHAAADLALRETSAVIRASLRADDIACRYGGEELVVILPDTPLDEAAACAEKIRVAIAEQQLRYQGAALGVVTASFGVAASGPSGTTAEGLLRAADVALYAAKHEGRNRVCSQRSELPPPSNRQTVHRPTPPLAAKAG
jgi:diguanylate cyclase (GGDEF)-like protein